MPVALLDLLADLVDLRFECAHLVLLLLEELFSLLDARHHYEAMLVVNKLVGK